jgi:hypothetical protein
MINEASWLRKAERPSPIPVFAFSKIPLAARPERDQRVRTDNDDHWQ